MSAAGRPRLPERGATVIEFALLLPVLLLLLLGSLEGGRYLFMTGALNHAIGSAARCAEIDPSTCGSPAALAARIAGRMAALAAPVVVPASAVSVAPVQRPKLGEPRRMSTAPSQAAPLTTRSSLPCACGGSW
jgi:Flp pilus assembly pilin Flp